MRDCSHRTNLYRDHGCFIFFLFLFLVLLGAIATGCSSSQSSSQEVANVPGTVEVNDKKGPLFEQERHLISALADRGIFVPDSVVIVQDSVMHGYVKRIQAPNTIHLTTHRGRYPDAKIPDQFPYLFGRVEKPDKEIFRAWVVAHEIAHLHGPVLGAEFGRPALGLDTRTQEVQADIIALVLMELVYGVTHEDLGYPGKIDYPIVPDKSVVALQRKYCVIVQKTWSVEKMSCF